MNLRQRLYGSLHRPRLITLLCVLVLLTAVFGGWQYYLKRQRDIYRAQLVVEARVGVERITPDWVEDFQLQWLTEWIDLSNEKIYVVYLHSDAEFDTIATHCDLSYLRSAVLSGSDITPNVLDSLARCPRLRHLYLVGVDLRSHTDFRFQIPAHLQRLHVSHCRMHDRLFEEVESVQFLSHLELISTDCSDRVLEDLSQCSRSPSITIKDCPNVTDEGVLALINDAFPQQFLLEGLSLTSGVVDRFARKPALGGLRLFDCGMDHFEPGEVKCLVANHNLMRFETDVELSLEEMELVLDRMRVNQETSRQGWFQLALLGNELSSGQIDEILAGQQLQDLWLSAAQLDQTTIDKIGLSCLPTLCVTGVPDPALDLKPLQGKLYEVFIKGMSLSEADLKPFSPLPIRHVSVTGCEMEPGALTKLSGAEILTLDRMIVPESDFEELTNFGQLHVLTLRRMPVSSMAIELIQDIASLKSLKLTTSDCPPETVERLRKEMPQLMFLE